MRGGDGRDAPTAGAALFGRGGALPGDIHLSCAGILSGGRLRLWREPFEKLALEYIEEYDRKALDCPLHAGAAEVLEALEAQGLRQLIVSASKQKALEEQGVQVKGAEMTMEPPRPQPSPPTTLRRLCAWLTSWKSLRTCRTCTTPWISPRKSPLLWTSKRAGYPLRTEGLPIGRPFFALDPVLAGRFWKEAPMGKSLVEYEHPCGSMSTNKCLNG